MITAIPQVTNDSTKKACADAIIEDKGLQLLETLSKSSSFGNWVTGSTSLFSDNSTFNTALADWVTVVNTGVLDVSDTNILLYSFNIKATGSGNAFVRVIEKTGGGNLTHTFTGVNNSISAGNSGRKDRDFSYTSSTAYKTGIIIVDVSSYDSIELSIQLKTTADLCECYYHRFYPQAKLLSNMEA